MSDDDPSVQQAHSPYRVLRLASLLVNAVVAGIIGTGLLAVFALWLQKQSGLSLEPGQFRQLLAMIFGIITLSAYVVLEYFQHRREQRAAKAAKAAAKTKKKSKRPEPQFQPIFAEPEVKAPPPEAPPPSLSAEASGDAPAPFTATQPSVLAAPGPPSTQVHTATAALFVQTVNAAVAGLDQQLSAFAEFGLHLFVMGGCGELARKGALSASDGKALLARMLKDSGLSKRNAASFAANANTFAQVPNFRGPIDAGYRAMAHMEEKGALSIPALHDAFAQWSIQEGLCAAPEPMSFVATAVAAGANAQPEDRQRVLRAHAKATSEVLAQFQGREIANLGSGIIATFTNAAAAVRAAEGILEQLDFFAGENPKLIVSPRAGVDTEMAATAGGAYITVATARVATIAALAPAFQIYCTEATSDDCAEILEFAPVPPAEAYGDLPPLFEAQWSRAPAKGGPALEYRQLGVLKDMSAALLPNP